MSISDVAKFIPWPAALSLHVLVHHLMDRRKEKGAAESFGHSE
jgi:hypothetical protein